MQFASLLDMAHSQLRPGRKSTGGYLKNAARKKKEYELGREPAFTKLGKTKVRSIRTPGGHSKYRMVGADTANVFDPAKKSYSKVKIKSAVENPANRNFVRRNILTKGCVIETEAGKARITSRPGQDGVINAVLVQ